MGFEICFKASKANGNFYKLQQVVQGVKTVQFLIFVTNREIQLQKYPIQKSKVDKSSQITFLFIFSLLKKYIYFFLSKFCGLQPVVHRMLLVCNLHTRSEYPSCDSPRLGLIYYP